MRRRGWTVWGSLAVVMAAATARAAVPAEPGPPLPPRRPAPAAVEVPLPPVRPADLRAPPAPASIPPPPAATAPPPAPQPLGPPAPPKDTAVPIEDELVCTRLFGTGKVVARALAPIGGMGGCGIAAPVEVSAVVLDPTRRIALVPPVTIDCALGEAVADWVREDLVPAFAAAGAPLARMVDTSGYACRGRNRVPGAKLSEHGRGNAMDIGGFATADGKTTGVKQAGASVLASVRSTACARFATVLGPGSDGFHEAHLHVDLEARKHGGKLCQWDLPGAAAASGRGPR